MPDPPGAAVPSAGNGRYGVGEHPDDAELTRAATDGARDDSGGEGEGMTDQDNTAPAVWDPTARGGAGGWVRRKPSQDAPTVHQPTVPPPHVPPQAPPASAPGSVDDQGPPLAARPYLPPAAPPPPAPPAGYGYPPQPPQHPQHPQPAQARPAAPTAPPAPPGGFPGHAVAQAPYPAFPNAGPNAGPAGAQPGFPAAAQPPFPQPPQPPQPPHQQQHQQPHPAQPPQPVGYPGQAEYGDYEEVAPYDDEPRRSRTPLYIALGVALAVMLGVGVVWAVQDTGGSKDQATPATTAPQSAPAPAPSQSTGGADPTASSSPSASAGQGSGPKAAAQAKSLDDLLSRGESAKAPIGNAVAKVTSCPGKAEVDSAAEVFDAGATQRDQLIADLAKLDLNDLPGGAETAQTLRTAWQQSGDIDRAYAAWARTVSSEGCTNNTAPSTTDLKRANELNPQATQSKKDFVAKWNSLAGTFNLAPRTWDRI